MLDHTYAILKGKSLPHYFKTRETLIKADLNSSLEELWSAHEEKEKGTTSLLDVKIEIANRLFTHCEFCERRCSVNRLEQSGNCGVQEPRIASEFLFNAVESVLVPTHVIFFSGCNFHCIYCQNWDISEIITGRIMLPRELAKIIEYRNLRSMTFAGGDPIPNLNYILEVLRECNAKIPVAWDSNMYLTEEGMRLLDGVVDVYLTDFKYGNNRCAEELSSIQNYFYVISRNHLLAEKNADLIIRHLVLPNHLECCAHPVLQWISENLEDPAINVMFSYRPEYNAFENSKIDRYLTSEEKERAFDIAEEFYIHGAVEKDLWKIRRIPSIDPDHLESEARSLIAGQDYLEARSFLEQVRELAPEREQSLQNEFGFLYNFAGSAEEDEKRWNRYKELIEWRMSLWYVLSEKNDFPLEVMEEIPPGELEEMPAMPPQWAEHLGFVRILDDPNKIGETLENAILRLFRQFFTIAKENGDFTLEKLRKQKKGTQFGFDISFRCSVRGNENVKCRVECKNIKDAIRLKDISPKLASTKVDCPDIDHWILISPRSNPSNELNRLLSKWCEEGEYPFEIQIWCPDTGVEEFFGLIPDVYEVFYKPKKGETHPSKWSEKERHEIFEKWKEKLKPVTHLPKEWDGYIREPFRMCLTCEDSGELENLYRHYVPLRCMDERKNILGGSLEQHVRKWLTDTEEPTMLLLGEFGDGKTAFTYILSRNLANEFLEDTSNGWISVRFALKDYYSSGDSREFLRRRLEEFGADIAGWNKLKVQNNLLVILDGFDEMTKELDKDTIAENIDSLMRCCDEFKGSRILITSRTHFFEKQKDMEGLLQRLHSSRVFYLAPIDRNTNIRYLEDFATTSDEKRKLKSIYKLHDPIGLAAKPLFLQMIKETLNELPEENLDEVTLYETYIEKSLNRKSENLDRTKIKLEVTPKQIYSNLVKLLERIALDIQGSDKNYFSLEEFENTSEENFAELLWEISGSDELTGYPEERKAKRAEDVRKRIKIRSLLTRVDTGDNTHKCPVDFCHRSVREYFAARGICRALREDRQRAKKLLTQLPLNHEILYFTAELMKREKSEEYENNLLNLIRSTRRNRQSGLLGANAATLLFRLKGELPGGNWSKLNLDYADLSGSDLSYKNFWATSLKHAKLDNVNFEGADFRKCDLTGVWIEETASVLAVAVHPLHDRILAAYADNTIREWSITQKWRNESQVIGKNAKGSINLLESRFGSDLFATTNEEVIFYDFEDQGGITQRASFGKKSKYRQVVAKKDILLLLSDQEDQKNKVLLIDLQQRKIVNSLELEKIALCENLDQQTFVISEGGTSLKIIRTTNQYKEMPVTHIDHEVTSLCVHCCKEDAKYLLACGQRDGKVFVWQIDLSTDEWQHELLLKNHIHDGLVSSLAFLDDSTFASGGIDRKISIVRFGPGWGGIEGIKEPDLQLTARCKGLKIDGIKRDIEQEMLRRLILKAEEILYHGNE